jgi:RNA polymerase sigma-70 factor (ECF subfamily)
MASTPAHGTAAETNALFARYEDRPRRTVRLRISGIVDPSSVLDLVRNEAARRAGELAADTSKDPFLWLRQLTGQVLTQLHCDGLGSDSWGEISLHRGALPEATSISLAAHLLGKGGGEDQAAVRAEQKVLLQEALNAMDPLDREVLTLRHCEQLSNDETAAVLNMAKSRASEAYIRALTRITQILAVLPGFKCKP